jgi:hypothetical protein
VRVVKWWGLFTPLGLRGFRFEGLDLFREFLDTLDESVVEVDNGTGLAEVEFGELDAETLDDRVVDGLTLFEHLTEFGLKGVQSGIDVTDIDFGRHGVGWLLVVGD